jgi:hypothetical protein
LTSGEISIGRRRFAVLVLAGLLCLAALAPASALAGSISGTVIDASTLEPVESLEVCAYPMSEEWEVWFCDETDVDGEYAIEDLEADEYAVEFWGRPLNYIPQFFDGHEAWWEADILLLESSESITGVDAELVTGGRVEGVVEEAGTGLPLEEIAVCGWTIDTEEFGGCAETDADGEYAIGGMPAGEYEIEFWPQGQNYLPQYYDHKAHWWEADPVSVALGATTPGIDADLLPGAAVEGQVRHDGSPDFNVEVCAWSTDPEGAIRCAYPDLTGHYAITGLPGDEYKVEFWPFDESLPVQFWDHKPTWDQADPVSLATGSVTTGIDADLGALAPPPTPPTPPAAPAATPSTIVTPPPSQTKPRRKRCKKGFRKKRVHGKVRCVKKKRARHSRRAQSSSAPARTAAPDRVFRFGR